MSILFKKIKKFQRGSQFDKLNPQVAADLGVKYVGKHPRAQQTGPIGTMYPRGNEVDNYTVINPQGEDITPGVKENFTRRSLNAAAEGNKFITSAQNISGITGGTPITRTVNYAHSPGFADYVKTGSVSDLSDDYVVGNITDVGRNPNSPRSTYPITKSQYLKHQGDLQNVLGSNISAFNVLGEYFGGK